MKIQKLTPISNKNINSLFKHYSSHLDYKVDPTYIKPLYRLIKQSNVEAEQNYKTSKGNPKLSSAYMSKEITEYIKSHSFHEYTTNYNIESTNVIVGIHSHTKIDPQPYLFFIKLVLLMCTKSATATLKQKEQKVIHIQIILTPIKKTYPETPVEPYHINSGLTCPNKNEITVFRKEEWLKVFIHECFHLFNLDFSDTNINYTRMFKNVYHVKSEFLLFETFTEFWARIFNLSIVSYFTKDKISYREFEKSMKLNIQIERLYSIAQMNHLLKKMNYTYEDLIAFNKPILTENTNFFCYYVLTAVLFFDINHTMNWLIKHNSFIQFSNNNVYPFIDYIIHIHKTPQLLSFVRQLNKPLYNANMAAFEILF